MNKSIPNRFDGKVALVTGGNSGIGRAIALAFAREGAKVVIAARRRPEGEETVRTIKAEGGEAIFVSMDVSQEVDVKGMIAQTIEAFGRLDYACNNAGVVKRSPLIELSREDFDHIISINLTSVWLCMKYELTEMLKHGAGVVVNMSSTSGLVGSPDISAYIASKHGVIGLTKAAAQEYAQSGVRINTVAPGYIRTPMLENEMAADSSLEEHILKLEQIGRVGTPENVSEAVIWLCSDSASFVNGHTLVIDGGATSR